MHIGIVGPCSSGPLAEFLPDSGGVDLGCGGYSVVELVRALAVRKHRLSVITLSPNLSQPRILKGPNLTYYVYPARTKRKMRDFFRKERQSLREGILSSKPDILHAHWTYEFALACLETDLPTMITSRDDAFEMLRLSKDAYRLGRLYMHLRVLRKACVLTAVSPYLADSLRWLSKAEIHVIPNGIDVPKTFPNGGEDRARSIRIATVLNGSGNRKNPKTAIQAFNMLRRNLPDAEMFMYGANFEDEGPIAQWATKHGFADNIRFCGPRPRAALLRELKEMSILLHPALEESFGMAILEAMGLGIPVVAGSDSGAVPWVLDQGRAGFLTDVKNPKAVALTLLTCIKQHDDRERRRRNAYERARGLFSVRAVAEQYEKLYEKLLASPC